MKSQTESIFKAHEEPIYSLCFTKDDKRIVTASRDYTARFWDIDAKRELQGFTGHSRAVNGVKILPDGETVVTSSEDASLRFWKLRVATDETELTETREMCGVRFAGSTFAVHWENL